MKSLLDSTTSSSRGSSPGRPSGHFTQSQRFERLKKLLIKRPAGATLREIAEHLNVSQRTARRYLQQLDREFPVQKVDGPGKAPYWRLVPQQRLRRVALRRSQAYALLAVRPMFSLLGGSALYDDIESAYEDILDIAQRPFRGALGDIPPARFHERFVFLPEAPADYSSVAEDIDTIFQATADLRPVLVRHLGRDQADGSIEIHPYALIIFQDTIWVLAAVQPSGSIEVLPLHDLRNAYLPSAERFELPEGFDPAAYFDGAFGPSQSSGTRRVTIDFDAMVGSQVRLRRVHPTQRLSSLPSGGVRWTATVRELEPVKRWVLGFGSHARVVEPADLRAEVIEELRAALGNYRPLSSGSNPSQGTGPAELASTGSRKKR